MLCVCPIHRQIFLFVGLMLIFVLCSLLSCLESNRFIYPLKWSHCYFTCCFYLRFCLTHTYTHANTKCMEFSILCYDNKWFVIKIIYWFSHFKGSFHLFFLLLKWNISPFHTYDGHKWSIIIIASSAFIHLTHTHIHSNCDRIDWTGAVIINFDVFTDKSARAMIYTRLWERQFVNKWWEKWRKDE